MTYAVIMAGGSGTRFWPKSTKALPKQFLNLFGEGTMLQNTVERIKPVIPLERVLVVTNSDYVSIVEEQLPGIPSENIIAEVVAKNTAPCVAIAASILEHKDENATMVVLPADHHITDPDAFLSILSSAIEKANTSETLVTIGIQPDRPETGYGYIHADEAKKSVVEGNNVLGVFGFREKPNADLAKEFLDSGDYFWNSGMFIWKASTVLKSVQSFLPAMFELTYTAREQNYSEDAINQFYIDTDSISIDYGIMEDATNVFVVPGEFGWNDVGSWTAVFELAGKDNQENATNSEHSIFVNASSNLISSESGKVISLVGINNIAVVETDKAILVCNLDEAQGVKTVVDALKANEDLKGFL